MTYNCYPLIVNVGMLVQLLLDIGVFPLRPGGLAE
jgi:hypothetical protein